MSANEQYSVCAFFLIYQKQEDKTECIELVFCKLSRGSVEQTNRRSVLITANVCGDVCESVCTQNSVVFYDFLA